MDHFLKSFLFDYDLFNGIVTVMGHVMFCSLFSTFLWNWLYDAKCDFAYLWSYFNSSTASLSGPITFLCLLVTIASAVALLMVFSWKRTVVFLVQFAHLLLLFLLPLTIFADFLDTVPIRRSLQFFLLFSVVFIYLAIGSLFLALFTNHLSPRVRRLVISFNCSFISVILLRCLPHESMWQLILVDIAWDSFSVFAGPVRTMFQNSHDYGEKMVRCVLFSAADATAEEEMTEEETENDTVENEASEEETVEEETENETVENEAEEEETVEEEAAEEETVEEETEDDETVENETAEDETEDETVENETAEDETEDDETAEKKTAEDETASFLCNKAGQKSASDALGGVQLGMGDFVLFTFLVAHAWIDHPSGAVAALFGIIVGLFTNFVVAFSYSRRTDSYFFVPALPCPMLLGMALHFGTLFAIKTINQTEEMKTIIL